MEDSRVGGEDTMVVDTTGIDPERSLETVTLTPRDELVRRSTARSILERLRPEQRVLAEQIAAQFNPTTALDALSFAVATQRKLLTDIDAVSEAAGNRVEPVSSELVQLQEELERLDVDSLQGYTRGLIASVPGLNQVFDAYVKFMRQRETIGSKMTGISETLESRVETLIRRIALCDTMAEQNTLRRRQLQAEIAGGELRFAALQAEVEQMKKDIPEDDPEGAVEIRQKAGVLTVLRQRLYNMYLGEASSFMNDEAINIARMAAMVLLVQIQDSILIMLPNWKILTGLALVSYDLRLARETQQAMRTANDKLLERVSAVLGQEAVRAAEAGEQGVASVDSLRKVKDAYVSVLKQTTKIITDGAAKQQAAIAELQTFKEEISVAIRENAAAELTVAQERAIV